MRFEAWKEALSTWVPIAENYAEITFATAEIMLERFGTPTAYEVNKVVIMAALLAGFPAADRSTVARHTAMKKNKELGSKTERERIYHSTNLIMGRARRLFRRLKTEIYGRAEPAEIAMSAEEADKAIDEVNKELANPSPIIDLVGDAVSKKKTAKVSEKQPSGTDENEDGEEENDEESDDDDDDEEAPGNKKKKGGPWGINGNNDRQGKAKQGQPNQDLYETSARSFEFIKNSLNVACNADTTIFEPFAGNGKIVSYLQEMGFTKIISRDLYIPDEEGKTYDFFTEPFPQVDGQMVIVTNTPWGKTTLKALQEFIKMGVLYFALFRIDILCYEKISALFKEYGVFVVPIRGQPQFINGPRDDVTVGYCAWFIGGPGVPKGVQISYEGLIGAGDVDREAIGILGNGDQNEMDEDENLM